MVRSIAISLFANGPEAILSSQSIPGSQTNGGRARMGLSLLQEWNFASRSLLTKLKAVAIHIDRMTADLGL